MNCADRRCRQRAEVAVAYDNVLAVFCLRDSRVAAAWLLGGRLLRLRRRR